MKRLMMLMAVLGHLTGCYQATATPSGVVRLNTITGQMEYCKTGECVMFPKPFTEH